jgi:hypothetical protein
MQVQIRGLSQRTKIQEPNKSQKEKELNKIQNLD